MLILLNSFVSMLNKLKHSTGCLFHKGSWLLVVLVALTTPAFAKVFYVAPDGNNSNPGTISAPFLTIQRAQDAVVAGDTVYLRGGLYTMTEAQIASWETPNSNLWVYVTFLNKSGTSGNRINYWAYPGEQPVFDYQHIAPANRRVNAFQVNGSWLHLKGIEVIGVQVTITNANTQSICFSNEGSNNIYEQLSMHDGQAIGFYLTRGSNNLILNCDAYRNYDYTSKAGGGINGGNVDGFGNHPNKGGVNNVFRGCRAWFNSDDGFDSISAHESTLIENCWAFYNGYSGNFVSRGDGNGFKVGGYGSAAFDRLPNPIPRNTTRFCLAVRNKASGFYANHHLAGGDWFNNTAYMNSVNYNMLNRKAATPEEYLIDVPGYDHIMKNNLGFSARSTEVNNLNHAASDVSGNYFNLSVSVTAADFVSLEQAQLTAPRKPDGSLPDIDFMRLAPGSDLIDAGVDIGFPFFGARPDLGYREYQAALNTEKDRLQAPALVVYPVPAGQVLYFHLPNHATRQVSLSMFNLQGKQLQSKVVAPTDALQLSLSDISNGVYIVEARDAATQEVISRNKIIKQQ